MGSQYLLSGLLRCGVCGKPYSAQAAKGGQFAYYIGATLYREGAGACTARYLNAGKVEDLVIEKVRERILTEETITELVTLVAEEIDNLAGEINGRLKVQAPSLSEFPGAALGVSRPKDPGTQIAKVNLESNGWVNPAPPAPSISLVSSSCSSSSSSSTGNELFHGENELK